MPSETAEMSKKIEVKADTDGLDKGRDFVVQALIDTGVDADTVFALTTSYLELFENIIRHGYAGRAGTVTVEVISGEKTMSVAISDTGLPFNLLNYKDVGQADMIKRGIAGKMGIKTIMTLCDRVEYARVGNFNTHMLIKNRG